MPDIKIGDNTLTGVSELQCVNADDTTQHVIFYSAPRAILAVTAPAGSTIDVLQNSIVLQTYTLGAAETSHSFKVDVSTTNYVVKNTTSSSSQTREISITANVTYLIDFNAPKYLKWNITQLKTSGIGCLQASEFCLLSQSGTEYRFPGCTITTTTAGNQNEGIEKLIDGSTSTKYCAGCNSCTITIYLATGIDISTYNRYRYYTANDVEGRDPVSWTIQVSIDGTNYSTVASVTSASITSSRYALAGTWSFT